MLTIQTGDAETLDAGLLMIPVAEDDALHKDKAILALVETAQSYKEFKGKKGDDLLLYRPDAAKAERVLFLGVGKIADLSREFLRKAAGKAVKKAISLEVDDLLMGLPDAENVPLEAGAAAEALFEGACLGNHIFDHYKADKKQAPVKHMAILANSDTADALKGVGDRVETICKSTVLARDWVSMPPNEKRPDRFVRSIVKAADKEGLEITVLDEQELKKNKMGGILAVGMGSKSRARMVILDYKPKKPKKTYALIGKGVTFDSGGINLKSGGTLEDMKMDMAGGASVAAALIAAARLKPDYRVIGIVPVVENMPSGDALRPGDIVRTYSGKTVEIGNTDAEGRMILIDALAYAEKLFKPDVMIDMATLTGA
ncbi:MAG TPA: M17 family peptidase N-terminal domain-containing protein, partial [Desulfosalsimonadaceae bacterium]|nr:M17 family peptidase N-terminal domain-containing protein [Desulfosalsimonadaceae bacterium]